MISVSACSSKQDSPEAQVRALINQAESDAEKKESGALRRLVSEKYSDSQGQDKKAIEAILRYYFLRNESIHLLTRIQQIAVPKPETAQAVVLVAMAGQPISSSEELERIRADLYRFELSLSREDGEWRVIRAEWRRAEFIDFL
jgi:predicted Zn-dependent peptidase